MSDNSIMDSLKSLVSPKTIPFLISQGVVPKLLPVVTLTIGVALGFIWAYLISPSVYTGADFVNLEASRKAEVVKEVAWEYSAEAQTNPQGAADTAKTQLSYLGDSDVVLTNLLNNTSDPVTLAKLQAIQPFAVHDDAQMAKVSPSLFNGNITPFLCVIGILLIPGLAVIVNTIIPITLLFQPKAKGGDTTSGTEGARRAAIDAAEKARATAPAAPVTIERGTPVGQYMSTYIMGDDLYDDSFAIETASGEFLGETGAGISKVIGVGDPKKVTATEVWVFDKTDIKTLTKVLMSEHAYNDEALRAELAPKGEAILVKAGTIVMLETTALTVQARIVDVAYGSGSLPPDSFYERLTVEISAWPKKPGEATAGSPVMAGATVGAAPQQLTPPPPPPTLPGTGDIFDPSSPDAFGDTTGLSQR